MPLENSSKLSCTLIAGSGNGGSFRNNGGWHLTSSVSFCSLPSLLLVPAQHLHHTLWALESAHPLRDNSLLSHLSMREFFCYPKKLTGHKALGVSQTPQCGMETKKHRRSPISQQIMMRLQSKQEPHSRAAHVRWAHVLLWARVSEIKRVCSQFGGPGHPWLSWILSESPFFSFPGWKAQFHLGIPLLTFRKCTVTDLVHIYSSSVSVWEENLKGYFSDMVYHLTVINKTTDTPWW